jgi:Ca2+-binding EF-hand superfamily protein
MAVLVTVNNQPLRKVFRTMDLDQDGLISTAELMTGLTHYGLSPFTADDESFRAFAESFCKRQSGQFGFSEFNRFINQRKHGQATKIAGEPLRMYSMIRPKGNDAY